MVYVHHRHLIIISKSKPPSAAELEKNYFYYFNFDGSDMHVVISTPTMTVILTYGGVQYNRLILIFQLHSDHEKY